MNTSCMSTCLRAWLVCELNLTTFFDPGEYCRTLPTIGRRGYRESRCKTENQALEGVQVISAEQVDYVGSTIARSICKLGLRTLHERKQYLVTQQKLRRFICRKRIFAFAVNYMLQLTLRHKGIWMVQAVFHWFCKGSLSQYWKGCILKLFFTLGRLVRSFCKPFEKACLPTLKNWTLRFLH